VRDEIDEDAAGVPDRARHVVDEVEGRDIAFPLAGHDRDLPEVSFDLAPSDGIIEADDRLHVVRGVQCFLKRASGRAAVKRQPIGGSPSYSR
jgi:hypothetical protein